MPVIHILKNCQKEVLKMPEEIRGDLADDLARLDEGHKLSLPLSRPMSTIAKGVHELRFRDRAGVYRVIYFLKGAGAIYLLHAFKKKTQQTPKENIEIAKKRLKEVTR